MFPLKWAVDFFQEVENEVRQNLGSTLLKIDIPSRSSFFIAFLRYPSNTLIHHYSIDLILAIGKSSHCSKK